MVVVTGMFPKFIPKAPAPYKKILPSLEDPCLCGFRDFGGFRDFQWCAPLLSASSLVTCVAKACVRQEASIT